VASVDNNCRSFSERSLGAGGSRSKHNQLRQNIMKTALDTRRDAFRQNWRG